MFDDNGYFAKMFNTFIRQISRSLTVPVDSLLRSFRAGISADTIGRKASKELLKRIKDITKGL